MHVMKSWLVEIGVLTETVDLDLKKQAKELVRKERDDAFEKVFTKPRLRSRR